MSMERAISNYYLIESSDYTIINRVCDYCNYQGKNIPMYKTRLTTTSTGWVVELPIDSKTTTAFLLNFSHIVTLITRPFYQ